MQPADLYLSNTFPLEDYLANKLVLLLLNCGNVYYKYILPKFISRTINISSVRIQQNAEYF